MTKVFDESLLTYNMPEHVIEHDSHFAEFVPTIATCLGTRFNDLEGRLVYPYDDEYKKNYKIFVTGTRSFWAHYLADPTNWNDGNQCVVSYADVYAWFDTLKIGNVPDFIKNRIFYDFVSREGFKCYVCSLGFELELLQFL